MDLVSGQQENDNPIKLDYFRTFIVFKQPKIKIILAIFTRVPH